MADVTATAALNVAWDGVTPAIAPAGSMLSLSLYDLASVPVEITGTFVATVVLEVTTNGTTWFAPNCLNVDKTAATASLTAAGRRLVQAAGYAALRARMSAWTSGAAAVSFGGSYAPV